MLSMKLFLAFSNLSLQFFFTSTDGFSQKCWKKKKKTKGRCWCSLSLQSHIRANYRQTRWCRHPAVTGTKQCENSEMRLETVTFSLSCKIWFESFSCIHSWITHEHWISFCDSFKDTNLIQLCTTVLMSFWPYLLKEFSFTIHTKRWMSLNASFKCQIMELCISFVSLSLYLIK